MAGLLRARAAAKRDQLGLDVVGVLPGQARVLRRHAGTARPVAARARRHAAIADAAAIDLLAERDELLVLGESGLRLLARVEGGDVLHVGFAQRRRHRLHDRVVALAGLELGELLDEVVGVLALDDRVGGAAARAVIGVAGGAHRGRDRSRPWPVRARWRRSRRHAARMRPEDQGQRTEQTRYGLHERPGSRAKASNFTMSASRR